VNAIEQRFFDSIYSVARNGFIAQHIGSQIRIDMELTDVSVYDEDDDGEKCSPFLYIENKIKVYNGKNLLSKTNSCIHVASQKKVNDGYIIDFELSGDIPIVNMAVEIDGHDWHEKTKEQAKSDKERSRFLLRSGYPEIRFTGSEIYSKTSDCAKEMFNTYISVYYTYVMSNPESHNAYIHGNK